MPAITQNKITPILVLCGLAICGYVLWGKFAGGTPPTVKAGPDLTEVPRPPGSEPPQKRPGGMLGVGALSNTPAARAVDADSPAETLKTVMASNNELRAQAQRVLEANQDLQQENAKLRGDRSEIVSQVKQEVLAEMKTPQNVSAGQDMGAAAPPSTAANAPNTKQKKEGLGDIVDAATDGYGRMVKGLAPQNGKRSDIPSGLGYDGNNTGAAATGPGGSSASATGAAGAYTRILPVGFKEATGGDGKAGIIRANGHPIVQTEATQGTPAPTVPDAASDAAGSTNSAQQAKKKNQPYYTIPENATLTRATMMTALVGRVPIDGRVQDPMQFKLLIGRENLAANGQYVPDKIAGIVVTGIAIGDIALSCSEGLVQSLTFVFDDGTIHTVSLKKNGVSGNIGGSNQQGSISQSSKLAWLSDEYGNPCISGKFVTNAPAYLTDVVGLKTLGIAAQASALAQTTTSSSPLGSTNSVTGDKRTFVLGQAAGAGVDEVSNWILRRLNNSFDAVVTPAGARVVVHFEQEVSIDKAPDARKLDYGGSQTASFGSRRALD
jgi:integrating conjugative element protein (TIGR03752 family)